jgi:hypothetical protein
MKNSLQLKTAKHREKQLKKYPREFKFNPN